MKIFAFERLLEQFKNLYSNKRIGVKCDSIRVRLCQRLSSVLFFTHSLFVFFVSSKCVHYFSSLFSSFSIKDPQAICLNCGSNSLLKLRNHCEMIAFSFSSLLSIKSILNESAIFQQTNQLCFHFIPCEHATERRMCTH